MVQDNKKNYTDLSGRHWYITPSIAPATWFTEWYAVKWEPERAC